MARQRLGIIINGITGRMGTHQHLARSMLVACALQSWNGRRWVDVANLAI
jgi:hypothetical protein